MNISHAEYVDHRFRFFGYGDPTSCLWFVGIEEGGDQESAQGKCEHKRVDVGGSGFCYDPELPVPSKGPETSVWPITRDIAQQSGVGSEYFLSNVAPLGRRRVSDKLEGIESNTYRKRILEERLPALKILIGKYKPKAVVFHGKAGWRDYGVQEALGLVPEDKRVVAYPDNRLIFTNFFSRRFGSFKSQDQAHVVQLLRDWNVADRVFGINDASRVGGCVRPWDRNPRPIRAGRAIRHCAPARGER